MDYEAEIPHRICDRVEDLIDEAYPELDWDELNKQDFWLGEFAERHIRPDYDDYKTIKEEEQPGEWAEGELYDLYKDELDEEIENIKEEILEDFIKEMMKLKLSNPPEGLKKDLIKYKLKT